MVQAQGRGLRAMAPGLAHARRAAAGGTARALPGVAVMEVVMEADMEVAMEAAMGDAHPAGADMGAVAPAGRIADANGRKCRPSATRTAAAACPASRFIAIPGQYDPKFSNRCTSVRKNA